MEMSADDTLTERHGFLHEKMKQQVPFLPGVSEGTAGDMADAF